MRRLLVALQYQTYQCLELVVVSDQPYLSDVSNIKNLSVIKHVHFDHANISKARNLGLEQASGEIVAFIDDDAVPEPRWAERLAGSFDDLSVGYVGGLVRGRNGLSVQWADMVANPLGQSFPAGSRTPETYPAFVGTNVAFRRQALIELGGFDPDFAFFLDETDMCLRMAQAGWTATFEKMAEVQHGFEESAERYSSRVPKTLFNLGRSKALFLRKHADRSLWKKEEERFTEEQEQRLKGHLQIGAIDLFQVRALMTTLKNGLLQGYECSLSSETTLEFSGSGFSKFKTYSNCSEGRVVAGRWFQKQKLQKEAARLASDGYATTVFRFSMTGLFHKRYFDEAGYWVQTGGIFGRSNRDQPLLKLSSFKKRVLKEAKDLDKQRSISETVFV